MPKDALLSEGLGQHLYSTRGDLRELFSVFSQVQKWRRRRAGCAGAAARVVGALQRHTAGSRRCVQPGGDVSTDGMQSGGAAVFCASVIG
jgi:hypothetical protein